jgi:hypothetical protein
MNRKNKAAAIAVAAAIVSGCGGGGGGANTGRVTTNIAPVPQVPPTISITPVTFISESTLPCVIRATSSDAQVTLHSAIEGAGAGKVVANITPLTELIVTQVHGADATDLFHQFATAKDKLTAVSLNDAKAKVRQALGSIIDLTSTDPIKDPLVAAVAGVGSNDLDKKIDTLRNRLIEADLKLKDLTSLLTVNTGVTLSEIVNTTLRPHSSACQGCVQAIIVT